MKSRRLMNSLKHCSREEQHREGRARAGGLVIGNRPLGAHFFDQGPRPRLCFSLLTTVKPYIA
jgi:hypothetical protein